MQQAVRAVVGTAANPPPAWRGVTGSWQSPGQAALAPCRARLSVAQLRHIRSRQARGTFIFELEPGCHRAQPLASSRAK